MTETANRPPSQLDYGRPAVSFWWRHRTVLLITLAGLLVVVGYVAYNRTRIVAGLQERRRLWDDRRRYDETAAEKWPADHLVFDAPMDRAIVDAPVDPPGRWELIWSKRRYTSPNTRQPLLFQGEMTTASGMRVLVAVAFHHSGSRGSAAIALACREAWN